MDAVVLQLSFQMLDAVSYSVCVAVSFSVRVLCFVVLPPALSFCVFLCLLPTTQSLVCSAHSTSVYFSLCFPPSSYLSVSFLFLNHSVADSNSIFSVCISLSHTHTHTHTHSIYMMYVSLSLSLSVSLFLSLCLS